ncbi:non-specific serine threonine protein, partial [Cystoisospora suis]
GGGGGGGGTVRGGRAQGENAAVEYFRLCGTTKVEATRITAALISLFSFFPTCSRSFLRTVLVYTSLDPFSSNHGQASAAAVGQEARELRNALDSSPISSQQKTETKDGSWCVTSSGTGGEEVTHMLAPPLLSCPYRISLGFLFTRFSQESAQVLLQPLLGEVNQANASSPKQVEDAYILTLQHLMQLQHTRDLRLQVCCLLARRPIAPFLLPGPRKVPEEGPPSVQSAPAAPALPSCTPVAGPSSSSRGWLAGVRGVVRLLFALRQHHPDFLFSDFLTSAFAGNSSDSPPPLIEVVCSLVESVVQVLLRPGLSGARRKEIGWGSSGLFCGSSGVSESVDASGSSFSSQPQSSRGIRRHIYEGLVDSVEFFQAVQLLVTFFHFVTFSSLQGTVDPSLLALLLSRKVSRFNRSVKGHASPELELDCRVLPVSPVEEEREQSDEDVWLPPASECNGEMGARHSSPRPVGGRESCRLEQMAISNEHIHHQILPATTYITLLSKAKAKAKQIRARVLFALLGCLALDAEGGTVQPVAALRAFIPEVAVPALSSEEKKVILAFVLKRLLVAACERRRDHTAGEAVSSPLAGQEDVEDFDFPSLDTAAFHVGPEFGGDSCEFLSFLDDRKKRGAGNTLESEDRHVGVTNAFAEAGETALREQVAKKRQREEVYHPRFLALQLQFLAVPILGELLPNTRSLSALCKLPSVTAGGNSISPSLAVAGLEDCVHPGPGHISGHLPARASGSTAISFSGDKGSGSLSLGEISKLLAVLARVVGANYEVDGEPSMFPFDVRAERGHRNNGGTGESPSSKEPVLFCSLDEAVAIQVLRIIALALPFTDSCGAVPSRGGGDSDLAKKGDTGEQDRARVRGILLKFCWDLQQPPQKTPQFFFAGQEPGGFGKGSTSSVGLQHVALYVLSCFGCTYAPTPRLNLHLFSSLLRACPSPVPALVHDALLGVLSSFMPKGQGTENHLKPLSMSVVDSAPTTPNSTSLATTSSTPQPPWLRALIRGLQEMRSAVPFFLVQPLQCIYSCEALFFPYRQILIPHLLSISQHLFHSQSPPSSSSPSSSSANAALAVAAASDQRVHVLRIIGVILGWELRSTLLRLLLLSRVSSAGMPLIGKCSSSGGLEAGGESGDQVQREREGESGSLPKRHRAGDGKRGEGREAARLEREWNEECEGEVDESAVRRRGNLGTLIGEEEATDKERMSRLALLVRTIEGKVVHSYRRLDPSFDRLRKFICMRKEEPASGEVEASASDKKGASPRTPVDNDVSSLSAADSAPRYTVPSVSDALLNQAPERLAGVCARLSTAEVNQIALQLVRCLTPLPYYLSGGVYTPARATRALKLLGLLLQLRHPVQVPLALVERLCYQAAHACGVSFWLSYNATSPTQSHATAATSGGAVAFSRLLLLVLVLLHVLVQQQGAACPCETCADFREESTRKKAEIGGSARASASRAMACEEAGGMPEEEGVTDSGSADANGVREGDQTRGFKTDEKEQRDTHGKTKKNCPWLASLPQLVELIVLAAGSCMDARVSLSLQALVAKLVLLHPPPAELLTAAREGPAAFARWAVSRGFSRLPPPISFADPCPSPWWSLPVTLPPPMFSRDQAEDAPKHSASVGTGSSSSGQGQSPHASSAQLSSGQQASSTSSPVDYFYYRLLSLILAGFHCFGGSDGHHSSRSASGYSIASTAFYVCAADRADTKSHASSAYPHSSPLPSESPRRIPVSFPVAVHLTGAIASLAVVHSGKALCLLSFLLQPGLQALQQLLIAVKDYNRHRARADARGASLSRSQASNPSSHATGGASVISSSPPVGTSGCRSAVLPASEVSSSMSGSCIQGGGFVTQSPHAAVSDENLPRLQQSYSLLLSLATSSPSLLKTRNELGHLLKQVFYTAAGKGGWGVGQSTPSKRQHHETDKRLSRHRERGKELHYEDFMGGKEILGATSLFVLPTLMALARVMIHPAVSIVDVVQGWRSRGREDARADGTERWGVKTRKSSDALRPPNSEYAYEGRLGYCDNQTKRDHLPVVACEHCHTRGKQQQGGQRTGACRCCCLSSRASAAAVRCLHLGEAVLVQGEQQGLRRRGMRRRRLRSDEQKEVTGSDDSRPYGRKRKLPCEKRDSSDPQDLASGATRSTRNRETASPSVSSPPPEDGSVSCPSCPTCSLALSDWPEAEVMHAKRLQEDLDSYASYVDQDMTPECTLWSFLMEADMQLMRNRRRRRTLQGPLQKLPTLREIVIALSKCPPSRCLTRGNEERIGPSLPKTSSVLKQEEATSDPQHEASCSGSSAEGVVSGAASSPQTCQPTPKISSGSPATDLSSNQGLQDMHTGVGVVKNEAQSRSAAGQEGGGSTKVEETEPVCSFWEGECGVCTGDVLKNSGPYSIAELQDILAALAPLADAHAVIETHILLHALTFRLACFDAPVARDFHAVHAAISAAVRETLSLAPVSPESRGSERRQSSLSLITQEKERRESSGDSEASSRTVEDGGTALGKMNQERNKLEGSVEERREQFCPSCTASLTAEKLQDIFLSLPLLRCLLLASQSLVPAIRQTALDFLHARLPPFCSPRASDSTPLQESCPHCISRREGHLWGEDDSEASLDKATERLLVLLQLGDAWKVVGGRPGVLQTIITLVLMASQGLQHREFFCDSDTPRFPPLLPSLPFSNSRTPADSLSSFCPKSTAVSSRTSSSFSKCTSSAGTVPWLDAAAEWNSYSVFSLDRASAVVASRGRLLSPYIRAAAQMYAHICSPDNIPLPWLPFHLPGYERRKTEDEKQVHSISQTGREVQEGEVLLNRSGTEKRVGVTMTSQTPVGMQQDEGPNDGVAKKDNKAGTQGQPNRIEGHRSLDTKGGELPLPRALLLDLSNQSSAFFSWKRDFDAAVRLHARFMVLSANLLVSRVSSTHLDPARQHRELHEEKGGKLFFSSSSLFYSPLLSASSSSFSLCFALLDLAFLAPRVSTSLCGSVLPALWSSAGPTLRRALTKALTVFLANPAHLEIPFLVSLPPAQQVQQHHHLLSVHAGSSACGGGGAGGAAVVQPLLAALLKCSPMPALPADLLCYLSKTYNCRHEALLLLEHAYLSAFAEKVAPRVSGDKETTPSGRKTGKSAISDTLRRGESGPTQEAGKEGERMSQKTVDAQGAEKHHHQQTSGDNAAWATSGSSTESTWGGGEDESVEDEEQDKVVDDFDDDEADENWQLNSGAVARQAAVYLRELYGQLEEPDYEAGVIASRLATVEGTAALALLQHGFYNQAKNKIVDAMKTVASPNSDIKDEEQKEEVFWWHACWLSTTKQLNQWNSLNEFAKAIGPETSLALDCASKLQHWDLLDHLVDTFGIHSPYTKLLTRLFMRLCILAAAPEVSRIWSSGIRLRNCRRWIEDAAKASVFCSPRGGSSRLFLQMHMSRC